MRRYVDHLLDLDVPVEAVRGRYGGYRLAAGYRMPPLMLGDDEALAVLLGLIAGRRAGLLTASGTASDTAAAKIRRMLPERLTARLDALLGQVAVTGSCCAPSGSTGCRAYWPCSTARSSSSAPTSCGISCGSSPSGWRGPRRRRSGTDRPGRGLVGRLTLLVPLRMVPPSITHSG